MKSCNYLIFESLYPCHIAARRLRLFCLTAKALLLGGCSFSPKHIVVLGYSVGNCVIIVLKLGLNAGFGGFLISKNFHKSSISTNPKLAQFSSRNLCGLCLNILFFNIPPFIKKKTNMFHI